MRAPQHDLGEVIHDVTVLENLHLFDDKDFYIHVNQPDKLVLYDSPALEDPRRGMVFLTREWHPDTW